MAENRVAVTFEREPDDEVWEGEGGGRGEGERGGMGEGERGGERESTEVVW